MAEIRVNTTGTLKLFDADDSHSAGIAAGTITADETLMTLNTADITFSIPKIVIGDATAEDTSIVFDGNAQDFYIGLDDSADDLVIGLGSTVGTTPAISIAEDLTVNMHHDTVISNDDNQTTLSVVSTHANQFAAPILRLYRNSSSPADDDQLAEILFDGRNDNSQDVTYFKMLGLLQDASDGSEDGKVNMQLMLAGTLQNYITLSAFPDGGSEIAINDGQVDINFRVESDTNANIFKVDAGSEYVSFGTNTVSTGFNTGSVLMCDTRTTANFPVLTVENDNASFAAQVISAGCLRSASASYFLFEGRSGNGSNDAFNDVEFKVNGAGSVLCDDTFQNNGADYAEFFETTDGNAIVLGTTVVLENNKVRAATNDDATSDIIGIVRPKTEGKASMIIGNSAWNKWEGKYLSDDFGQFIKEDITVTEWTEVDADGNKKLHGYESDKIPSGLSAPSDAVIKTVDVNGNKLTRNKLNPNFDESKTYSPRQDSDDWVVLILLGQIPVLKGQPTGTNWIKMRDISDTVEEWLVR